MKHKNLNIYLDYSPFQSDLLEAANQLKNTVLSFVAASKSFLNNPYGFMSLQNMSSTW